MGIEDDIKAFLGEQIAAAHALPKDEAAIAAHFDKYMLPDFVAIRPSGNPLTLDMWKGMKMSEDVVSESDELVSVDSIKMLADGKVGHAPHTTRTRHPLPWPRLCWHHAHERICLSGCCGHLHAAFQVLVQRNAE